MDIPRWGVTGSDPRAARSTSNVADVRGTTHRSLRRSVLTEVIRKRTCDKIKEQIRREQRNFRDRRPRARRGPAAIPLAITAPPADLLAPVPEKARRGGRTRSRDEYTREYEERLWEADARPQNGGGHSLRDRAKKYRPTRATQRPGKRVFPPHRQDSRWRRQSRANSSQSNPCIQGKYREFHSFGLKHPKSGA